MFESVDKKAAARWLAIRIAALPVIFVVVSAASHFLLFGPLGDDDPAARIGGQGLTNDQRETIRDDLHLDDPWVEQYARWVTDAAQGDLGKAYFADEPIGAELRRRIAPTAQLLVMSLVMATLIGAVFAHGLRRAGAVRATAVVATSALRSIPIFITLTLAIIVPAALWNYAQPVGGYVGFIDDPLVNFRLMFPASLLVGVSIAPMFARALTARGSAVRQSTARSPVAFAAVVAAFPAAIGALVVAEQIMSIRGVGGLFLQSIFLRDLLVAHTLLTLVTFSGVSLCLLMPHRTETMQTSTTLAEAPHRWLLLFGASIVLLATLVALLGPFLWPHDPRDLNVETRFQGPSWEHWFGTNQLGQDQLSRLMYGLRDSLWFSSWVVAVGVAAAIVTAGALAVARGRYMEQIAGFGRPILGVSGLWWVLAVLAAYRIRETPVGLAMALGVFVIVLRQLAERPDSLRSWSRTQLVQEATRLAMLTSGMFASVLLLHATLTFYVPFGFIGDGSLSGEYSRGVRDGVSYPHLIIFSGLTIFLLLFAFNLVANTLMVSERPQVEDSASLGAISSS